VNSTVSSPHHVHATTGRKHLRSGRPSGVVSSLSQVFDVSYIARRKLYMGLHPVDGRPKVGVSEYYVNLFRWAIPPSVNVQGAVCGQCQLVPIATGSHAIAAAGQQLGTVQGSYTRVRAD
jgi:hypothetical protein